MKNKLFLAGYTALMLNLCEANTISENQQQYVKRYEKQECIIAPENMLINTDSEPQIDEEFADLYNGKDLTGWTTRGGRCIFNAIDEAIEGVCVPGSPSTYLCTDKADYTNFIFTVEVKWLVNGNTGIMFRSNAKPSGHAFEHVYGPQAELEGTSWDRGWSGGIYGQGYCAWIYPLWLDAHQEVRASLKPAGWNRLTIKAEGDTVKTWFNGIPAAHWIAAAESREGFFGLQIHSGEKGSILFRNLKVKEL